MRLNPLVYVLAFAASWGACVEPTTTSSEPPAATAAAPAPLISAYGGAQYGMNISEWADGLAGENQLDAAAVDGVRWVRGTIYWNLLQPHSPTEAEPRFNQDYLGKLKRYVERANNRNMQVTFVVHASPDWARLCDANHKNPEGQDCGDSTYPPHDAMYAWWREFLADLMREFPTVAYWGVWNEPNSSSFFNVLPGRDRVSEYNKVLAYAADSINGYGRQTMAPELGPEPSMKDFLRGVLQSQGHRVNVIAVHHYGIADDIANWVESIPGLLDSWGVPRRPIWLTEYNYGYPTAPEDVKGHTVAKVLDRMNRGWTPDWKKSFPFTWDNADTEYRFVVANPDGTVGAYRWPYYCYKQVVDGLRDPYRYAPCRTGLKP
jgi:hypothetical protein